MPDRSPLLLSETRRLYFNIRQQGSTGFVDLSTATSIVVRFTHPPDASIPDMVCDRNSGADNWIDGLVTVIASPDNVTATPGTYRISVVVTPATGPEQTYQSGVVEVGYDFQDFRTTSWGSHAGLTLYSIPAASALVFGQPVIFYPVGGIQQAVPYDPTLTAPDAIALSLGVAGRSVFVGKPAWVSRADWTSVIGTPDLTPGQPICGGIARDTRTIDFTWS